LSEDPEQESDGKVAVVSPMPYEVTGPNVVSDVKVVKSIDEVVSEGAGLATLAGTILRKPYREIRLPGKWILPKMGYEVI
jgi:hypothetical protein